MDCSTDPTTGNVAFASLDSTDVVIYKNARGSPHIYSDPYAILFYCAYDDKGNLYIDLVKHGKRSFIGRLWKGSSAFENISVTGQLRYPGGIQWDGKYVAIDDVRTSVVYRVHFSGLTGTVVGTTRLSGVTGDLYQFWLQGHTLIGPDASAINFWKYPAGGSPVDTIESLTLPVGVTISLGTK